MKNSKRTIIITGSSRGIGLHLAKSLAKEGHNIVINYHKNKKEIKKLSELNNILIIKGDVSKLSDVENIIEKTINEFGKIDVLINNAGIHIDKPITKVTQKEWQKVSEATNRGWFKKNAQKKASPEKAASRRKPQEKAPSVVSVIETKKNAA